MLFGIFLAIIVFTFGFHVTIQCPVSENYQYAYMHIYVGGDMVVCSVCVRVYVVESVRRSDFIIPGPHALF